ncbi:hypothetical protein [Streptomyces axinellae]|uniref:Uncharacterized protein n=1 Tax=Streptomyces axinellae TaxID=552788 RepID=A0ABN3PYB6_9ACTN
MLHTPNRPVRQDDQTAQHDDGAAQAPLKPARFEVLISSNGSAALNGDLLPVAEGEEVHVAVLDALQNAAQSRGASLDATILDLRENGYATHIRVEPDGSSRMLVNGAPAAEPAAEPVGGAQPVTADEGQPSAAPAEAATAAPAAPEPHQAAPAAPAQPGAGQAAPVGGAGHASDMETTAVLDVESTAVLDMESTAVLPQPVVPGPSAPFPPAAPEPDQAAPAPAPAPEAPAPATEAAPPPAQFRPTAVPAEPATAGAGASAAATPVAKPTVPGEMAEAVAHINRAAAEGETQRAMVLAYRLREHAMRTYGEEHPYTLETRDLEAYVGRLGGNYASSTTIYLELALICHRQGNPRAYGYLKRASGNWLMLTDGPSLVNHGRALLDTWAVLAAGGGPAAADTAIPTRVQQCLEALSNPM